VNNIRKAGFWIVLFLFLVIFFWSLLPTPIVEKSFPVDFNQPIFQNQDCRIDRTYRVITFHIKYPAALYFGNRALIEMLVQKELVSDGSPANGCRRALEMHLDMGDVSVEPKDRLIQPLTDIEDQFFIYEIQPIVHKRTRTGDLWIYLNSTTPDNQGVNRLPLFVIPIEIELRSLLGIPLLWLRLGSITAIFVLLIVKNLNLRSE
jgi:hypothetical protein